MKEISERARLLLARYRTIESLSPAHEERLLAKLDDALARGTAPRFDDDVATPIAVPLSWFQRAWSVPLSRPIIVILLMALPAVAAVGIAARINRIARRNRDMMDLPTAGLDRSGALLQTL